MLESAKNPDTDSLIMNNSGNKEIVFHVHGVTNIYQMGEVQVSALHGIDLDLYLGELAVLLGLPVAVNRRC